MIKKIVPILLAVVISGGVFFYVGMMVGQGSSTQTQGGNFRGFSTNASGTLGMGRRNGGQGGGFINGQIIAKDSSTITVQLNSGGSNIVLYSGSTKILKSVQGTPADLVQGQQVVVNGTANADGSITATTIQLRQEIASSTGR